MSIRQRLDEIHAEMTEWRRDFHAHPEIGFEEKRRMRQFMKTECRREAGEAMGFPLSRSVVGGCREATKSRRRGGGGPLRLGEHVFRVVAQRCSQVRQLNLRGVGAGNLPKFKTLTAEATTGFLENWTSLTLDGDEYKSFGGITAWRATLWNGDQLVGEHKSFLW